MSVRIELKGRLEPVILAGELDEISHYMNSAIAGGRTFFMHDDPEGNSRVVNMQQILTMGDGDEDDAFIA